ncbi:MAG: PEP-CTERM sorting domain-containing protein [Sphingomonas sp.]|nr:MAG: PEP-CTERM sorting domain-containing protein [Sphingomonas sp.]
MAAGDAAAGLQAMRELNLIVFQNVHANGQEVEGKSFIGGNLTGNGTNWGIGNSSQGAAASDWRTLTVNGHSSNSGQINNGSNGGNGSVATNAGALIGGDSSSFSFNAPGAAFDVGGNLSGNSNVGSGQTFNIGGNASGVNGTGGATVKAGGTISGNQNGATFVSGLGTGWNSGSTSAVTSAAATKLEDDLKALSGALYGLNLSSNPSTITYGGQGPIFNAVADGNDYALFNIAIDAAWNEINFNVTGNVPIIVNVAGTNIVWDTNAVGGFNSSLNQSIIWNFYEATSIDFQRMVHGSILAPFADIRNNTALEGTVVAKSFEMNGEVHLGTFDGEIPFGEIVPEPATWAMMIAGFGLVGAAMRRRRAAVAA